MQGLQPEHRTAWWCSRCGWYIGVGGEDVEFVRCGHRECMLIVHGVGGAITITVKYVPRSISFDTVKHWMPVR